MTVPPPSDYVEILNLYSEYNLCSDAADAEGYASCFARAGVLELTALGVTVRGYEEFVAWKLKDKAGRDNRYRRHWNNSLHLELREDGTVRGRCYLIAFNGSPQEIPVIADCGVYDDILIKESGAWKFLRRHLDMDATTYKLNSSEAARK